jgi:hypothetical protein
MSTANEYRRFAEECVRSAHDAGTQDATTGLLTVAQSWISDAVKIESGMGRHIPTPRDRGGLSLPPYSSRAVRW